MTMELILAKHEKGKSRVDHTQLPFSDRYISGTRRYFFREWDPSMISMLAYYAECPTPTLENAEVSDSLSAKFPGLESGDSGSQVSRCDFPLLVLEAIFANLHPMDLVHSASTVCRTWNRMAFDPRFWKDAVVTLCESRRSDRHRGARNFLQKMSGSLERLAVIVRYPTRCRFSVVGILPNKMPKLSHLEIQYRRNDGIADDVLSPLHFPVEFYAIDCCMPRLRCLILKLDNCLVNSYKPSLPSRQMIDLAFLNGRRTMFAHLESFQLFCSRSAQRYRAVVRSVEQFCWKRPSLELMRISAPLVEWDSRRPIHSNLVNLRGFSTVDIATANNIQQVSLLTKLVFLDISRATNRTLDLMPIRALHHLEHLHLGGWWAPFLRDLFQASSLPTQFPSSLKFLRAEIVTYASNSYVDDIVINCPQLRVLGVAPRGLDCEGIVKCFRSVRNLSGLRVRSLKDLFGALELLEADLPILDDLCDRFQYVRVCERKDDAIRSNTLTPLSIASLLKKFPNIVVEFKNNNILTYRLEDDRVVIMPELEKWKAKNAAALIQGSCCLR